MANIRIKDLANTASSTASDDFIGIDGATNGTRKLNAYSPSFGGNATVAGTLTVNGTGLSAFAGNVETVGAAASDRFFQTVASGTLATAIGQNTSGSTNAFGIASGNSYVGNAQNYGLAFSTNAVTRMTISNGSTGGNVSISSTTASTSTSTGALVVSGGLGVAGALYVGSKGQFQSNDDALSLKYSTDGGSCLLAWKNTSGTTLWSIGGGIDTRQDELVFRRGSTTVLNLNNSNNATFAGTLTVNSKIAFAAQAAGTTLVDLSSTDDAVILGLGGVTKIQFGGNLALTASNVGRAFAGATEILRWGSGVVNVYPSTASTSTSTGALVVSGGVGVAGAIYAGGVIGMAGDTRYGVAKVYNSSTGDMFGLEQVSGAQTGDVPATRVFTSSAANSALDFGKYTSATAFTNWLRIGTNGNVLVNTTTDAGQKLQVSGTAAFSGAISIGNTVNTVSPTSPNRTITIVIGGTTYYIHAKTTND